MNKSGTRLTGGGGKIIDSILGKKLYAKCAGGAKRGKPALKGRPPHERRYHQTKEVRLLKRAQPTLQGTKDPAKQSALERGGGGGWEYRKGLVAK